MSRQRVCVCVSACVCWGGPSCWHVVVAGGEGGGDPTEESLEGDGWTDTDGLTAMLRVLLLILNCTIYLFF